jgi:hypothetical protein
LEINADDFQQGAVTLLDVLGWKGMWREKPGAAKTLVNITAMMEEIQKLDIASRPEFAGLKPDTVWFSDTIVLMTFGDPRKVLQFHVENTVSFLSFCRIRHLPIRGAIGYGGFSFEENIFYCPAVDEVASWYEAVDWVGVILTPTASFNYQGTGGSNDNVLEYTVPMRKGSNQKLKCVDWFVNIKDEKELLEPFLGPGAVLTPDVARKYLNTLEFYRHTRKLQKARRTEHK